ncbi:hypothetical protein H4R33_003839 [Dimargaris cristalligena]|nr:hypothetical protein H4R33_003839 [Dimargaris cristalligena]
MASSFISSTTGGGGASSSSTTSYSNARFYNPFGPALDSPQVTFHRPFDDMSPPHHQHPSAAMDIPLLSLAKPRATATGFGTAESTELDSNDDAAESNDGGPGEAEEEEEEEDTFIPPGLACDMELTTFSKTPTHNSTTNSNGRPGLVAFIIEQQSPSVGNTAGCINVFFRPAPFTQSGRGSQHHEYLFPTFSFPLQPLFRFSPLALKPCSNNHSPPAPSVSLPAVQWTLSSVYYDRPVPRIIAPTLLFIVYSIAAILVNIVDRVAE